MPLCTLVVVSTAIDVISKTAGRRRLFFLVLAWMLVAVIQATLRKWDYETYGHGRCFMGDVRVRCDSDPIFKRNYHNIWFCLGDVHDPPECEPDILPSEAYDKGAVILHRQKDDTEHGTNYGVYVSIPSGQTTSYGARPKWELPVGAVCDYPRCNATSYLDYCP